jgi:hypothetical protein
MKTILVAVAMTFAVFTAGAASASEPMNANAKMMMKHHHMERHHMMRRHHMMKKMGM